MYCTLVERGAMKPADLVIHAGVAQGKIYSVLEELSMKGAVVKSDGRPTKYDAQNPRYVLDRLLDEVRDLKEKALQHGAEEAYEKRYEQMVRETTCWAVQGISGILVQLHSLAASCSSSLKVSDPDLSWVGSSEHKMFNRILREGKALQVLGAPAFRDVLEDLGNNGADVRTSDDTSPSYYLFDRTAVLLRFSRPDCGVVIRDDAFVRCKAGQFDSCFKDGCMLEMASIED